MKRITILLFLFFVLFRVSAQDLRYGVVLDTSYMLIGDQQKLTLIVSGDEYVKVDFPDLKGKLTAGVEIVSGPVRDSVKEKNGKWQIKETYLITSFDTGVYEIPEISISIEKDNYNNVLRTEPLAFYVGTFEVKKEGEYFDIVMPYDAALTFREILPYILYGLGALLFIAALIFGVVWMVKRKRHDPIFKSDEPQIPPYVKAVKSLDQLKSEELWQSGKTKEYYSRLTDTVRLYIDEELEVPAMEQTTFEIVRALANNSYLDGTDKEQLAQMLEVADFVKFAKMDPLPDANAQNMKTAYEFLEHVHGRILEEQRLQQEQKKMKEQEAGENMEKNA